ALRRRNFRRQFVFSISECFASQPTSLNPNLCYCIRVPIDENVTNACVTTTELIGTLCATARMRALHYGRGHDVTTRVRRPVRGRELLVLAKPVAQIRTEVGGASFANARA
ncbi:MAG TPA: hypothetical protein VMT53_04295, partial [Terriglobales bacterium]|nr:hypothetical protein [Terriglobales bacterium]